MSTPSPEEIKRVIEVTDFNIRMFTGYEEKRFNQEWDRIMLERLNTERALLVELLEGKRTFESMDWMTRQKFYDMPAWATYGT
jgi:hypothetical protein